MAHESLAVPESSLLFFRFVRVRAEGFNRAGATARDRGLAHCAPMSHQLQ
jgi:hypothetical protein